MEDTRRPVPDQNCLGPGAEQLARLLDSLIAIRLEVVNAVEDERQLSVAVASDNLLRVQGGLDTAIENIVLALREIDRHSSAATGGSPTD